MIPLFDLLFQALDSEENWIFAIEYTFLPHGGHSNMLYTGGGEGPSASSKIRPKVCKKLALTQKYQRYYLMRSTQNGVFEGVKLLLGEIIDGFGQQLT